MATAAEYRPFNHWFILVAALTVADGATARIAKRRATG
jgi:hypothetical protein